ncbi:MAG: class I mannose-6-phosphate isomerase [Acidobacteria bacterium]|nr:class I mannose-6-phosphate isomerase [Acidobacteriota bacterium]
MHVWQRPFALTPTFAERPWGVFDLSPWFANPSPSSRVGEAWFTADGNQTSLGETLGALTRAHGPEILGPEQGTECPLLVKILFTSERLSVQVHPDDEYAVAHHGPGSRGKTEAWHVIAAEPQATIGLGVTAPIAREQAEAAAQSGEIAHLMDWRPAKAGDTFLVPAGTVHALGPGLTLIEVQEQSDITYRLFDYGRGRQLHLQQGFDVADLGPYLLGNDTHHTADNGRTILTHCRYFTMESRTVRGQLSFAPLAPFFHLMLVVDGAGTIAGEPFHKGQAWCVPASAEPFQIESPTCDLVMTYPSVSPTPSFYDLDPAR